jgi:hypothetical protein
MWIKSRKDIRSSQLLTFFADGALEAFFPGALESDGDLVLFFFKKTKAEEEDIK